MFASIIALFVLEQYGLIGSTPQSTVVDLIAILLLGAMMIFSFFLTFNWGMLSQELALKDMESQYKRLFDQIPIFDRDWFQVLKSVAACAAGYFPRK